MYAGKGSPKLAEAEAEAAAAQAAAARRSV